jgi:hypothetical protein
VKTHPSLTSRVCAGWAVGLAFASFGFLIHDRQVQLDSFADFALLAGGNVGACCLLCPLHGFGSHFQTGRNLDLLATMIERRLLANHRLHAPHSG